MLAMFPPQVLILFVGLAFAAPLTSENINTLDRRGSTVDCNIRYGWSLSTNDCQAALAMLPVTSISVQGMLVPNRTPAQTRQGLSGTTSNPILSRLRESHSFVVKSGTCVIGVNPPSGGGINLSDWGSIAGRAYNIITQCVAGMNGHGGKDRAGLSKNIQVMVWQEEANEATA